MFIQTPIKCKEKKLFKINRDFGLKYEQREEKSQRFLDLWNLHL